MRTLLLLLSLLGVCAGSFGATLEWDRNTESNLAGYRVYVGKATRDYNRNYTTTNNFFVVTNTPGITFYAVTAFDTDGLESEFSDEVSSSIAPKKPGNLRFRASVAIQSADAVDGPWVTRGIVSLLESSSVLSQFYRSQWLFNLE